MAYQNINSLISVITLIANFDIYSEFDTLVGIIDVLGVSIVIFFNGHARLGSWLLKYEIFRSKIQSGRLQSPKNVWIYTIKNAVFRQPADACRCKNSCIF